MVAVRQSLDSEVVVTWKHGVVLGVAVGPIVGAGTNSAGEKF